MKGMMQGSQAGVVCIEANLCQTSEVAAIFERCVGEAFQRRRLCTLTACSHGRLNGGDGEVEEDGGRREGLHGTPGSSCSPSKPVPPSPSKMTKMAKAVAKLKIKAMSKTLRRLSSHQPPVEVSERTSSSNGDSSGGGTIGGGGSDGSPKATTRWWSRFLKSATRLSPMSKPSGRVVPLSGAENKPKTPDFGYENAHQAAAIAALSHKYTDAEDDKGMEREEAEHITLDVADPKREAAVARREAKRAKREAKKRTANNKRAITTAATIPTTTSATTTATTATANTATISNNNNHDDDVDRLSASVTAPLVTHEQQPFMVSTVDDDAEDSDDSDTEEEGSGQRQGGGDGRRGGASSYETKSEACELIRSSIPLVRELPPPPLQLAGGTGMPLSVANGHNHDHKLGTGGAPTGRERREPASPEDDNEGDDDADSSATQRGLNEMWPLAFLNDEKQGFLRTLAIAKRKQWGKDAATEDVWTRWWCCICDRYLLAHESDAGISGQGQQQQQGLPPSPNHIIMLFDLWSPHTEYRPGGGETAFCIREVKVPNNNNDTHPKSDNSSGRRSSDSSDGSKRSNRAARKETVTHRFQSATKEGDQSWALAVQTRMLARDDPVERRRSKQLHANMARFLTGSSSGGLGDFLQHRPRQRISEAVGHWPEKRASYASLDDGSRFLRTVAFRNSVLSDFDVDMKGERNTQWQGSNSLVVAIALIDSDVVMNAFLHHPPCPLSPSCRI